MNDSSKHIYFLNVLPPWGTPCYGLCRETSSSRGSVFRLEVIYNGKDFTSYLGKIRKTFMLFLVFKRPFQNILNRRTLRQIQPRVEKGCGVSVIGILKGTIFYRRFMKGLQMVYIQGKGLKLGMDPSYPRQRKGERGRGGGTLPLASVARAFLKKKEE